MPVSDATSPTGVLSTWLADTSYDDIPPAVRERAKLLLLDGVGCLLVGAQLPWSRLGVEAVVELDGGGSSVVVGHGLDTSAASAAMLNGSFVQAFELDDYFPAAPWHANAVVLGPALAVAQQRPLSGTDLLRALVVGYEIGGRVGLALHGAQVLVRGWHSGMLFGGPAAAATAGALYGLDAGGFEDALGMAATQAGGLMSAQFESMVKRMQHGFAARNGLLAAALASKGYVGIKQVFERPYGGYLAAFGEGHDPDASQLTAGLGTDWHTMQFGIKPYAAMAGLHAAIDAARTLRVDHVESIHIEVGEGAFHHGGFEISRPLTPIGAQMSLRYATAVALLDGDALVAQFRPERLDADDVWDLVARTTVEHQPDFDDGGRGSYRTRVTVVTPDGTEQRTVEAPRGGLGDPLPDDEVVEKFRRLNATVVDAARAAAVEDHVRHLEERDPLDLVELLRAPVRDALA